MRNSVNTLPGGKIYPIIERMMNTVGLRKILLISGDIFLLYLALFLTVFLNFQEKFGETLAEHLLPFSILYFLWLVIFYIFGLYDLNIIRASFTFHSRLLSALGFGLVIGIILFYLFPILGITPRTNLLLNIFIFGTFMLGWRRLFYHFFSSRFLTNVGILGTNLEIETLGKEIIKRPYLGYKMVMGFNGQGDLLSQIQENKIDVLVVSQESKSDPKFLENLYRCLPARVNFMDWAKTYEMICDKIPLSFINQSWFLENLTEGGKKFYDFIKRAIDTTLALILLIATCPLWLMITLAIKLEDGGIILYKQKRIGKDRKSFILLKFRSMKTGAEKKTGPVWAKEDDPRATKIGRLIRRLHLDELPQMINVLKGDIALVGPRPERPEFVENLEKEIPHFHLRHLIQPGFTGWAQIKFRYGRSIMDSHEKFQYDLYYLKNRSILLDIGIILKTFQLFLKK